MTDQPIDPTEPPPADPHGVELTPTAPVGATETCDRHYVNPDRDYAAQPWLRGHGAPVLSCTLPMGHSGEHGQAS